jgi:hypothetical protein
MTGECTLIRFLTWIQAVSCRQSQWGHCIVVVCFVPHASSIFCIGCVPPTLCVLDSTAVRSIRSVRLLILIISLLLRIIVKVVIILGQCDVSPILLFFNLASEL